jgi:hypothetical protein
MRGKVHDCLRPVLAEDSIYSRPVSQVSLDKDGVRVNGSLVALVEIVEDDYRLAGFDELLGDNAADIAGATCYQDLHGCPPGWKREW